MNFIQRSVSSPYVARNDQFSSLQRSQSTVINKRGFKPSDRHDPAKKAFLVDLSKTICHTVSGSTKHFTPLKIHKFHEFINFQLIY